MNYDEWLEAVDTILRSQRRGIKVTSIDQTALQDAFDSGVSPVVFAQNPVLPIKMWKPDSKVKSESKALPYLVSLLVIAIAVWWAKRYVGEHFRDQAISKAKFPLKLPVRGENGLYWPEYSHEAETEAVSIIKEYLMTPKDATNIESIAVLMPNRWSFDIEGKVTSKNKYGTAIQAPFQMTLQLSPSKLNQGIEEFKLTKINLPKVGDTNVWNRTDLGPYEQPKRIGYYRQKTSYTQDSD